MLIADNHKAIEKRLLSLWECGCYLSTHDFISLAALLGLKLPYKKRSTLLQSLRIHVEKQHLEKEFVDALHHLIDQKALFLEESLQKYPKTQCRMQPYLNKMQQTKQLLYATFIVVPKETHA